MNEYSDYNYRDRSLRLSQQPTPEIIRYEVEYRGLKVRRGDPNAGYMWNVFDLNGRQVIGSSFTKLTLAQSAVDRYLEQKGGKTPLR